MKVEKLFYITNTRIPTDLAHGIQIMNVCSAMSNEGMEVVLLVPKRVTNLYTEPFLYYGIKPNFTIKKLGLVDFLPLEKYLGRIAFWLQLLNFYLACFFYLLFQSGKYIIYTREIIGVLLSVFGRTVVYECHNIPASKQAIFLRLAQKADKLVVINENLKKYFIQNFLPSQSILVAHDGVDLEKFTTNLSQKQARQTLGLPMDKKIILYTGHLYKWKGVQILATAMSSLKDHLCYFVGGDKTEINKLNFNGEFDKENIILVEQQPHDLIPTWLKAADVLVLPNSSQEEISRLYTSPLKMFEYMASQRPLVAAYLPSLVNVLNKENCVFFEADNAKSLSDSILRVINDDALANHISQRSIKDVRSYSWTSRAKKIVQFIQN